MIFLRWYLWVTPHLLAGICLIGLFRRPRPRQLPLFQCYLIVQAIGFLCLLIASLLVLRYPSVLSGYDRINIADLAASELMTLAVIYELTDELVLSRLSLRKVVRRLMRWALALLLLVAAGISPLLQNAGLRDTLKIFQTSDFLASLLTLGLLLTILLFTRALHISWQSLPAGVALGFVIYSSVELSAAALLSGFGNEKSLMLLDQVRMGAFHVSVIIWLIYIFMPAKPPAFTGLRRDPTDLKKWDQELQKLVR